MARNGYARQSAASYKQPRSSSERFLQKARALPRAANSNIRLPVAVNDNVPLRVTQRALARRALPLLARGVARAIPIIAIAITAYDAYELYKRWNRSVEGRYAWPTHGFIRVYTCPNGGYPSHNSVAHKADKLADTWTYRGFHSTSIRTSGSCLNGQAGGGVKPASSPVPVGTKSYIVGYLNDAGALCNREVYSAPSSSFDPLPTTGLAPSPSPHPDWWASIDAGSMPVSEWLPAPKPVPWDLVPYQAPTPFSEGNESGPVKSPTKSPKTDTISPGKTIRYVWEPGPVSGQTPGQGRPQPRPKPERREPPKHGEKEKKWIASRSIKPLLDIVGQFSEYMDIVDAAYKAIPKQYRGGAWFDREEKRWKNKDDFAQRLGIVWAHADKIDVDKFIRNLINNHIQDYVIGRTSGAVDKVLKPLYDALRSPTGFSKFIPEDVWHDYLSYLPKV